MTRTPAHPAARARLGLAPGPTASGTSGAPAAPERATPLAPSSASPTWQAHDLSRPWSLNDERSGHWARHRLRTREARERWGWLWRQALPRGLQVPAVSLVALPAYAGHRQDTGNCYPAVKAAIDALVDIGFLADDGPEHVLSITLLAPPRESLVDMLTIGLYQA